METQFNDSCFKSKEEIKYFFIILQILFDLIIYFRTCEICGQKFQAEIKNNWARIMLALKLQKTEKTVEILILIYKIITFL
jgi:hypothetical protein